MKHVHPNRVIVRPQIVVVGLLWVIVWVAIVMIYPRIFGGLVSLAYMASLTGFVIALLGLNFPEIALLSPSFLTIIYTCVSFGLGAWAYETAHVLKQRNLQDYACWQDYRNTTAYFILGLLSIFILLIVQMRGYTNEKGRYIQRYDVSFRKVLVLSLLFLLFTQVDMKMGLFGGRGSFSFIVLTLMAIRIPRMVIHRSLLFRICVYGLLLLVFAAISFDNKRHAFLMLTALVIYDIAATNESLGRWLIAAFFLCTVGGISLLAMSVMRGYGGFEVTSLLSAVGKVPKYISNNLFISMLMNNIEASYSFFHSYQAIEYIRRGEASISLGSTLVKVLFIGIPRSIAPWKPQSIVHLYTVTRDPAFRNIGGSWPIHLFSEFYWNFRVLGLVLVFPVFGIANSAYLRLVTKIRNGEHIEIWQLFAVAYFLFYVRGSGLDLYVVYIVIGYFVDKYIIRFCLSSTLSRGHRAISVRH